MSLPIDGSKDKEIKIQACEHLPFKPILNQLDHDDNSMVKEDIEAKRSEIKHTPDEIEYPMKILRENSENIKLKAKRRRRVLPDCLFSLPASDVDESAYDRYSDYWYSVDSACSELEESIVIIEEFYECVDRVYTRRYNELIEDVFGLADTLKTVCEDVRENVSKQPEFDLITLVSQVLMFADSVQDDRVNNLEKKVYNLENL